MPASPSVSRRRIAVAVLATALCLAAAGPAAASSETLRRSVSNLLMAPLDIALSPVTAGLATADNVAALDSLWQQVLLPVPGYAGLLVVEAGVGALRLVTGAMMLPPGLALLPFEGDPIGAALDPFSEGRALVDWSTPLLDVRFGVTSPASLWVGTELEGY